jgi:hypothetical protein
MQNFIPGTLAVQVINMAKVTKVNYKPERPYFLFIKKLLLRHEYHYRKKQEVKHAHWYFSLHMTNPV